MAPPTSVPPSPVPAVSVSTAKGAPKRRRIWIGGVIAAVIIVLLTVLVAAPNPQAGSTYSRSLTGYRQWFDYMQQGRPVQRWQRQHSQLSGTGQTLIQIHPRALDQTRSNTNSLALGSGWRDISDWVSQGNTLIVLTWQGQATRSAFTTQLVPQSAPDSAGSELNIRVETTRRHRPDKRDTALLRDANGAVVWSRPLGAGQIIVCTYPWLAANALVEHPDNYRFLASLARQQPGPIWVDEWVHGHRDRPSPAVNDETTEPLPPASVFDYLATTPALLLLGQATLLLLLLIWGHNHRFGALITPTRPRVNASQQYIQALANTLNASRHSGFVQRILATELGTRLANRLGVGTAYGQPDGPASPSLDPHELAHHWAAVTGRAPEDVLAILRPMQSATDGPLPPHLRDPELLAWVSQVESLLRELP